MPKSALPAWHHLVESNDPSLLDDLLARAAVFHSPVVHTPQKGNKIVKIYLASAMEVLFNGTFKYVREITSDNDALLEFEVEIDGTHMNGIDLIHWNDEGRITDFKVMIRPLKAVTLIHQKMGEVLERLRS